MGKIENSNRVLLKKIESIASNIDNKAARIEEKIIDVIVYTFIVTIIFITIVFFAIFYVITNMRKPETKSSCPDENRLTITTQL